MMYDGIMMIYVEFSREGPCTPFRSSLLHAFLKVRSSLPQWTRGTVVVVVRDGFHGFSDGYKNFVGLLARNSRRYDIRMFFISEV